MLYTYYASGATLSFEFPSYTAMEGTSLNVLLILSNIPLGGLQEDLTITLQTKSIDKTGKCVLSLRPSF